MNFHICLSSLLTVLLFQGRFIDFITVLPSESLLRAISGRSVLSTILEYLLAHYGCFVNKSQWIQRCVRVSIGNKC